MNEVHCPLVDRNILIEDCVENSDVVDGFIKESSLPDKYKKKADWRDICRTCEWHGK